MAAATARGLRDREHAADVGPDYRDHSR
jgi:hypothetical protein